MKVRKNGVTINLTESDIKKLSKKILKEQNHICKLESWERMGYIMNTTGTQLHKDISPALRFYIIPEKTPESKYCNYTLVWEDGMTPIDLGKPDFCYSIAEAYEEAFKMKRV